MLLHHLGGRGIVDEILALWPDVIVIWNRGGASPNDFGTICFQQSHDLFQIFRVLIHRVVPRPLPAAKDVVQTKVEMNHIVFGFGEMPLNTIEIRNECLRASNDQVL